MYKIIPIYIFLQVKFCKSIFLIERKDFGNRSFNNKCGNMKNLVLK